MHPVSARHARQRRLKVLHGFSVIAFRNCDLSQAVMRRRIIFVDRQRLFVATNADSPRWRAAILSCLQSLRRPEEVEALLSCIQDGGGEREASLDRRLLLAEAAFLLAPRGSRLCLKSRVRAN